MVIIICFAVFVLGLGLGVFGAEAKFCSLLLHKAECHRNDSAGSNIEFVRQQPIAILYEDDYVDLLESGLRKASRKIDWDMLG